MYIFQIAYKYMNRLYIPPKVETNSNLPVTSESFRVEGHVQCGTVHRIPAGEVA